MESVSTNNRGFYNWIPIAFMEPPTMDQPEGDKGKNYHGAWARYFISRQRSEWIDYYRSNFQANVEYAIDSRWGEEADIKMFLGDKASQTSRIPFKYPIVSPTLTRMVGAVDNISITAMAESVTQHFGATRKENELLRRMLMSQAAQAGPAMASAYEPIGVFPDEQKTEGIFDMSYTDHIKRGVNSLMASLSERNKLVTTKRRAAEYMALSGMAAFHNFINGTAIESSLIYPDEVGWDTSAIKPDMSDGQYVYHCPLMDVGAIAEKWKPAADIIRALDKWARVLPNGYNLNTGWPQSRPRVLCVYWKDYKRVERGYVNKNGELEYCVINVVNPDTGKPDYTDSDLVDPPKNKYTDTWTPSEKSSKKQTRYTQVLRYTEMIPWEWLPGGYTNGQAFGPNMKAPAGDASRPYVGHVGDIILGYGEYPLQEADPDNEFSVSFPIKIATWRSIAGHVVAPLTAIRDPQRWINQVASDIAWRLRKAGNKSPVIAAEGLVGTNMDEDDIRNALKEGDPLFLSAAQVNGINNSIGSVDNSPGASFYNMLSLLPQAKQIAESSIGVYESNYGAPQGQDQLVGTLQLQLQQAGVMQQPFYAAIADLYRQQNQFYAQAGKEFYSRFPWLLRQMVGDEDVEVIISSKDLQLEQFRVKIDLSIDTKQLRTITDQQVIPGLMQMGMLDPVTAAQLMGRSIPDDVYAAARKFTKEAAAMAQQQQEAAAMAQRQQSLAIEDAALREEENKLAEQQSKAELDAQKVQQKLMQPFAQAEAKWTEPPEQGPVTL